MPSFFATLDGRLPYFRLATLILILFLAISSQPYILIPYIKSSAASDRLYYHLLLFNLGVALILWTFWLVCTTDPGRVRDDWIPDRDAHARYCKLCKTFKPPRTHHCRTCRRCLLRMDHHCPWLSCCVGYHNHAYFVKFMVVVVPTTGYLTLMSSKYLWQLTGPTEPELDASRLVLAATNLIAALLVTLMVFCLLCYQVWCVMENITTIESWSKKKTEDLVRRRRIAPVEFPYDLYSVRSNLREILGREMKWWVWPPTAASGDGHSFPVNEDCDPLQQWPPRDSPPLSAVKPRRTGATLRSGGAERGRSVESGTATGLATTSPRHRNMSRTDLDDYSVKHGGDDDLGDEDEDEDFTFEAYGRMGLIIHSDDDDEEDEEGQGYDSSDEYVDGEGEYLECYGVEEDHQVDGLDEVIDAEGTTVAVLLQRKRRDLEWKTGSVRS